MTTAAVPAYFEESWAILSSIDLINIFFGFMIIGITKLSPLALVPIITSAAGSIANGMSYYAYYAHYPETNTAAAAAVGDITWLIQEAGMSFYSYIILIRVLSNRSRTVFMVLFWTVLLGICIIRAFILVNRAQDIVSGNINRQHRIDHLHIGYFSSIALLECISAFFLLRKLALAKKDSIAAAGTSGLFSYLMRSTEIRLTILACIGFSRAITYSFQTTAQSATTVASQVDRFVYTLECLFPIMMFIDILASRVVVNNHMNGTSSQSRSHGFKHAGRGRKERQGNDDIGGMYSMNNIETRVDASGQISSSQERMVDEAISRSGTGERDDGLDFGGKGGGISKTVEFDFHESGV